MHFQHLHLDKLLSLGGRWKEGRRGEKNKGEMDDRRQKVEDGETSKRRSFYGSWGEMRKKVSLHQTQELPLLQTVPAQRLHETRYLTLNWCPTVPVGESGCVCLHVLYSSQLGHSFCTLRCLLLPQPWSWTPQAHPSGKDTYKTKPFW